MRSDSNASTSRTFMSSASALKDVAFKPESVMHIRRLRIEIDWMYFIMLFSLPSGAFCSRYTLNRAPFVPTLPLLTYGCPSEKTVAALRTHQKYVRKCQKVVHFFNFDRLICVFENHFAVFKRKYSPYGGKTFPFRTAPVFRNVY